MVADSCEEVQNVLVDYVDGELTERDVEAVARHLAGCPVCRKVQESLERSLRLAKTIWLDNLNGAEILPEAAPVRRSMVQWSCYAAVAGVILIVVGVLVPWSSHGSAQPDAACIVVERQVVDVATAARLLMVTQILARCEGTESIVEEQCRYIRSNYAGTPAATMLTDDNLFRRDSQ